MSVELQAGNGGDAAFGAQPPRPRSDAYPFLAERIEGRRRVRAHLAQAHQRRAGDRGTASDGAGRQLLLQLLEEALVTELACVLRDRERGVALDGAVENSVREEFLSQVRDEQGLAERIRQGILELGGAPGLVPPGDGSGRGARMDPVDDDGLAELLEEDLIAEHIAVGTCREMIRFLGDQEASTRRLFESILARQERRERHLAGLRANLLGRRRA